MTSAKKTILAVFVVCALPIVIAAYLHLFSKPERFNNYGTLITPQLDVSSSTFKNINGDDFTMTQLKGKWVLVQTIHSDCDKVCQETMFYLRQARKTKGKDADRIERVAFVTDDGPLDTLLLRQFPDVHFVRASTAQLENWLPVTGGIVGTKGSPKTGSIYDHVFMVDPLGHVMMRFPENKTLEFQPLRKDISRLLWASNIG